MKALNYFHSKFEKMTSNESIYLTVYNEEHEIQNIVIISAKDCGEPVPAREYQGFHYPITDSVLEDIILEPNWTIQAHNYNQAQMLIDFNNHRIEEAIKENEHLKKFV